MADTEEASDLLWRQTMLAEQNALKSTDPEIVRTAPHNQATAQIVWSCDADGRFLGPEISHSKGVAGGIVVLWPRIIPGTIAEENAGIAAQVQAKVKALAEKALPGRAIDVRPKPERVCPKAGCDAVSINVLFTKNSTACVAVALINAPGTSSTKLIPWGGGVELKSDTIQFRDMPENFVKIKDYVPCDQLITSMAEQDQFIEAALRAAAGGAGAAPGPGGTTPPATPGPGPSTVTSKPAAKK